jgi:hypothetical protein
MLNIEWRTHQQERIVRQIELKFDRGSIGSERDPCVALQKRAFFANSLPGQEPGQIAAKHAEMCRPSRRKFGQVGCC